MWNLLYSQFLQANRVPIPPVEFAASARRIAILVTSEAAKPTWDLGLRLKQIASFDDFPYVTAQTWFQKIYLRQKTVIELPEVPAPYTLRLEIPYWFLQIFIQVWDATEDLIPVTPAGWLNSFAGSLPSNGYVLRFDGYWIALSLDSIRTIGSSLSGAHIAFDWVKPLFLHLWNSFAIERCPLYSANSQITVRGATALEDWAANKRLALPDYRDAVIVGAGNGRLQGTIVGSNTNTLSIGQLPAHNHQGSSLASGGSHLHTGGTDAQGSHGHNLVINAAGAHAHSMGVAQTAASGTARNHPSVSPSASLPTDTQGSHAHTGGTDAQGLHGHNFTTSTAESHTHTLTIQSQGSGQSFSVMQRSAVEHLLISVGAR